MSRTVKYHSCPKSYKSLWRKKQFQIDIPLIMSVTFVEFSGCDLSIMKLFCHESKSSSLVASLRKDLYFFKRFPFYSAFSTPFSPEIQSQTFYKGLVHLAYFNNHPFCQHHVKTGSLTNNREKLHASVD